jgi:hypothetical protein
VKIASNYLQLDRLEKICDSYLEPEKEISIPKSTFLENVKWIFENLREDPYDLSDIIFVCNDGKQVKGHSLILCAASRFFRSSLLSEGEEDEKKKKVLEYKGVSSEQMEIILRYLYTNEFNISSKNDVLPIWLVAEKAHLNELLEICEKMIIENLNETNVDDILKVAESINSESVILSCMDFKKNIENKIE